MYLETYEEYSETYDRDTVKKCRLIAETNRLTFQMQTILSKGVNAKAIKRISETNAKLELFRVMGERYERKEKTIQKWMEQDARWDALEKNAIPPSSVYCEECKTKMEVQSRVLITNFDFETKKDIEEVQFIFACPRECGFQPLVHADGSPVLYEAPTCPKCGADAVYDVKVTKKKSVYDSTCTVCNYSKHEIFDTEEERKRKDKHFSNDRVKYCMSDEKGQQYVREKMLLDIVLEVY